MRVKLRWLSDKYFLRYLQLKMSYSSTSWECGLRYRDRKVSFLGWLRLSSMSIVSNTQVVTQSLLSGIWYLVSVILFGSILSSGNTCWCLQLLIQRSLFQFCTSLVSQERNNYYLKFGLHRFAARAQYCRTVCGPSKGEDSTDYGPFNLGQAWIKHTKGFDLTKTYRSASAEGAYLRSLFRLPFVLPSPLQKNLLSSNRLATQLSNYFPSTCTITTYPEL